MTKSLKQNVCDKINLTPVWEKGRGVEGGGGKPGEWAGSCLPKAPSPCNSGLNCDQAQNICRQDDPNATTLIGPTIRPTKECAGCKGPFPRGTLTVDQINNGNSLKGIRFRPTMNTTPGAVFGFTTDEFAAKKKSINNWTYDYIDNYFWFTNSKVCVNAQLAPNQTCTNGLTFDYTTDTLFEILFTDTEILMKIDDKVVYSRPRCESKTPVHAAISFNSSSPDLDPKDKTGFTDIQWIDTTSLMILQQNSNSNSKMSSGTIAGIVIGSTALIGVIILAIIIAKKK